MRKHHRAKNTHSVICFLMTQPPHLEESTILMCKEETDWIETNTGCAQRCQAATRWQAVLGWRKKKLTGVSRVPDNRLRFRDRAQSPTDEGIIKQNAGHRKRRNRAQPVYKTGWGTGMKAFRYRSVILYQGPTGCWAQRPDLFFHRGLRITILVSADKII